MRLNPMLIPVLSCVAAMTGSSALAVPIHPGDVVNLNGTTAAAEPWLVGVNADGASAFPFTVLDNGGVPVFQGVFTSEPRRSDILGTTRVRYRLRDMQAVGDRRVARVDILGFAGLQTNVEYRTDGIGVVGPNLASRVHTTGAQISFIFSNPLLTPGLESRYFHVHSNGAAFTETGIVRVVLNTGESAIFGGVHIPALTDCPNDVNGDGVINFADLNSVLTSFGNACP